MKNVNVVVDDTNSLVYPDKKVIGLNYENLQGYIIFSFKTSFIDGVGWLEVKFPDNTTGYLALAKEDSTYKLPIKSSLLKQKGKIFMQLRITEEEVEEEIPVFKSNMFYLQVNESLNTTTEIPEEYPEWISIISDALNKVNNLDIELTDIDNGAKIEITKKDKTKKIVEINNGIGIEKMEIINGELIVTYDR